MQNQPGCAQTLEDDATRVALLSRLCYNGDASRHDPATLLCLGCEALSASATTATSQEMYRSAAGAHVGTKMATESLPTLLGVLVT